MYKKLFLIPLLLIVGCAKAPVETTPVETMDVESCMDAVVHIRAYQAEQDYNTEDYLYEDFQGAWQGSGCFIREDGVIMTAGHVVDGAERFEVTLRDGTILESSVAWAADNMDVGFIKVKIPEGYTTPCLAFDQDGVEWADTVFILGHPLGWMNNWTISKGIISNLDRDCEGFFGVHHVIQSDAAAYPGNSGGPVIDESGKIVGVLVGGIRGHECLAYITPAWIASEWADVFFAWLETR